MEIGQPLEIMPKLQDSVQNLSLPLSIDTEHSSSVSPACVSSDPSSLTSPPDDVIPRMNLNNILHHQSLSLHQQMSHKLDAPVFPGQLPAHLVKQLASLQRSNSAEPSSAPSSSSSASSTSSISPRSPLQHHYRPLPSMQDVMFNTALQGFVGQTANTPLTGSQLQPGTPNAALVAAAAAAAMATRGPSQTASLPGIIPNTPPTGLLPPTPNDLMSQAMNNVYAMWGPGSAIAHAMAMSQQGHNGSLMPGGGGVGGRRPRSEKKPIPDAQKDDKYYERRKRNNNAAKKSRDSRKAREDEIAIRASFLEKENAILRAQVGTLREEANSLRQLLLQKRAR